MRCSSTGMWAPAWLAGLMAMQAQGAQPVLQRGYDANVSGANLTEATLNTSNVGPNTFGRLFNLPVDADVFAQPLYVPNVAIPNQGTHNVLYVATMNDSLYAFDADVGGAPLWSENLAAFFDTTAVLWNDFDFDTVSFVGNLGILSTPVIDPANNKMMYVVACTLEGGTMAYRLHAIDITTGSEPYGPGVLITGSYGGATFDGRYLTQRVSLVISGNDVVFAFGGMEEEYPGEYVGWVMAYNKTTLQQSGAFATITTSSGGGVWQSGRPPVVDSSGYVYVFSGNGFGDGYDGVHNFSESVLKFDPSQGLKLLDWFTAGNWSFLDKYDQDLTSSGPLLIPGTTLLAGGGKSGYLYVLNSTDLGKYNANDSQVVQKENITAGGEIHGGPVYWNRSAADGGPLMYDWGATDVLKAFSFNGSTLSSTPTATGTGTAIFPGGMLTLSANGSQAGSGLLWATTNNASPSTGILHAYEAANVSNELWNSMMTPTRDGYGAFAKYVPPVVANGKVYVPTFGNRVSVYGLGVAPPAFTVSPTSMTFGNVQTNTASTAQSVTVTNNRSAALPITSITFMGTAAGQFSQTNTCGSSIPAGLTCTISVVFTPTSAVAQTAWLYVNGGNGAGTKTTALTGTGIAPFTVTPASVAFGSVPLNTASAAKSATVANNGSAALPLTSISIVGASASQFSQTNNCGSSVPVASTCTISVVFTPVKTGYLWATLNVTGPGITHPATVDGTGIVPFTVSPTSVAFGDVPANTASAAKSVTVTNNGSIALPITSVNFGGASASQFSQTNTCGSSVPVGSTCTISIVFRPTSTGYLWATLNVTEPGLNHPATADGTGTVPFTVSPASVAFGSVPANTASAAKSVTVTNNGSIALPMTSINFSGPSASQFSQTNTCGSSVPVGSTCTISIVFTPTSTGYLWATLNVTGPGLNHTATVDGTGT